MDKAEQRALAYAKSHSHLGYDYEQTFDAVKYGYLQADQDLALTWEDVAILITIYEQEVEAGNICRYEDEGVPSLQDASEIILRRFNEIRKK